MRLVLSSLIVMAGFLSGQAAAAPEQASYADIRDSGFVYCVSGQVNTFNPQKASSGLIVDTLAAQLYDRLLDVDPYTYRLVPELAESWEVLDNGATYRFHLRRDVPFQKTAWFTPTRKLNADDVVFTFEGTVAKLAMRQPFVLFKGLTFQKLCLPGAFRPGDHHNKMLRPG
ncbi:ABC transporter substrate-binding protein, partial [Klebsiella pneumoniae]|uniref:ABC transporter substrate-binding protein n=1 Tax=Klebsiella pneumoniae TaxID=573 RepID=UPI00240696F0